MEANCYWNWFPLVTPAERARDSEVQRMAQQYGGNDMRLALMEKAPGDQTPGRRPCQVLPQAIRWVLHQDER